MGRRVFRLEFMGRALDLLLFESREDLEPDWTELYSSSISEALQEQLGLRLVPSKSVQKYVRIERVEKPAPN